MRIAPVIALFMALWGGHAIGQPVGIPPIQPLNQGALGVAIGRCFDEGLAGSGRAQIEECQRSATVDFHGLDALRDDPRMRYYIWGTCADVSGYTTYVSADTIRLFGFCAWRMMERCSDGLGDGYELEPVQCMRAIRSMGWVPARERAAHPKRPPPGARK